MINVKFEHQSCQKGTQTSLGIMFEITAPVAPVVETSITRKPRSLIFLVDRSGSMGGGRLEMVRQTILDTLPRLHHDDLLSVVTFDDSARVEVELQSVGSMNRAEVIRKIEELQTGGQTNLEQGYRVALAEAAKSPSGIESTVLLLSDGKANAGVTDPVQLGQLAATATEHLVSTTSIGIGKGYDESVLGAVADSGNGNHIAALELDEALRGLQAEIDDLLSKTIIDFEFQIQVIEPFIGPETKIRKTRYLRKFVSRGSVADGKLGDLSSGEEKNLVFEITLDHQDLGSNIESLPAIDYTYHYFDVVAGELKDGSGTLDVALIDPSVWIEPARDEDILAELKAIRLQDVRERAFELYRQGREQEADDLLTAAGEDLMRFIESSSMLSDRTKLRMSAQYDEVMGFATLDDANIKRKRLGEARNRSMRDKDNFRDRS
jgi:Ca-activated chloride channel family protein